ncbi:hypothetical protein P171DRAFT_76617 [Karstenula rhodostoma CBS 690.94]|uniref:Uncharacterized protein n=1 Tax=Karstenula rhodostoma CBS 690.94 TaxID=1392251 RepID=A0A9P4PEQ6_9PLEO|nr:hypothetical protein P171DRAFT_76617 [Karstenula rhodostoma CBS 690.94]
MPAPQHQKSHYLLPLNSMIFKSKSSTNLPVTNQRNIYTKSTTTLAHLSVEEPDEELTALPLADALANPVRRKPKKHDLAVSSLRSRGSTEYLEDAPHPALRPSRSTGDLEGRYLEDDKKKESVWRRLIATFKKPFRKDKQPVAEPKEMVIGGPTDFKHLQTGTACLPGQPVLPAPENDDAEDGTSGDWETVRQSESTFRPTESFYG